MTRLEKAAAQIEFLINIQDDADPEMVAEAKQIAETLRASTRTDLNKSVWASVFACLKIKGEVALMLSNELEHAEAGGFADLKVQQQQQQQPQEIAVVIADPGPVKFTSDLNRRAWAIRRSAAARLNCRVNEVSWAGCLKLARAS